MFEHFTPDARRTIAQTYAEAHRLGHAYVGTEHLILALSLTELTPGNLLRDRGADHAALDRAVRLLLGLPQAVSDRDALAALGIDLDGVRAAVDATHGSGALDAAAAIATNPAGRLGGTLPFTRRAKKTLALGLRHAKQQGLHVITTSDLLMGVLDEGRGLGCAALRDCGIDLSALRTSVDDLTRRAA